MADLAIETWLDRWDLVPDGEMFTTHYGSRLMPVLAEGRAAMLKLAGTQEEICGAAMMEWFGGQGAVRIFAREGAALLMERATGTRDLSLMARGGRDDEAIRILCDVAARLHRPRNRTAPPTLVPLQTWFQDLHDVVEQKGGLFRDCSEVANELLVSQTDSVPLHGDLHHGNVLDGGARGWLAIDPKGLIGERLFDYANIFRNPDAETALAPGRLQHRIELVSQTTGFDPNRLLKWTFAYAGLGAAWHVGSGEDPSHSLNVAREAAALLGRP